MRILIITQYFWPENFRINDLAQGLLTLGHDVTVLTGKPNYPTGRFFDGYGFWTRSSETYEGIPVIRVPLVARGNGRAVRLFMNFISFAFFASILGPFRCRGSFDVILVYEPSPVTVGLPGLAMKMAKRAPLLFWVQDLWPESLSATGAVTSQWVLDRVASLVTFIYKGCDRVLVQSRAFIERVRSLGVCPEQILYYPNSAEELYCPVPRTDEGPFHSLPKGFRVMFAGNIGAAQSFDTILAAADTLRGYADIHWVILGDGRQFNWVKEEVARRGLSETVHLLGRHPVESMPYWFAHADVMLVTLRQDPIFALTIPSKLQSYMACGRPILAALEGEGARILEEAQAGVVVPAENPTALAEATLRLFHMRVDEREAMGQNGRRYFLREFARDTLIARLDAVMKDIVGKVRPCVS